MAFIQMLQYLGDHVPALGAFLSLLVIVSTLCLVFYKIGLHAERKRWKWDVEHMPAVIGQEIRERLERELAVRQARIAWLTERVRILEPLGSGVIELVRKSTEGKAAGR